MAISKTEISSINSHDFVTYAQKRPATICPMHLRTKALVTIAFFSTLLVPATETWADTDTATSVSAPVLIQLEDRAIPNNLIPSIWNAKNDRPTPYKDRCHTQQNLIQSDSPCEYGNLDSDTTIVLFGDSHALSWFPAIEKLAIAKNWKLVSLTMSSCWPADIPAWNTTTNKLMPNCMVWRDQTLTDIIAMKPAMIFVTGTRGFATIDKKSKVLQGSARTIAWEAGMIRTLDKLKKASTQVVMIGDNPISIYDVPECLKQNQKSVAKCSTPFAKAVSLPWLTEEQRVANIEKVTWVDPTSWICSTEPCSPLSGRYEIFVDKGHLTATFAAQLEKPLWKQLTTH